MNTPTNIPNNCGISLSKYGTKQTILLNSLCVQREIGKLDGQLKSAEIDNDFLRSENTQIRGDIGSLSAELESTRKSLVSAREDAQAQRAQSEQTLAQLQTALDRIQVQARPLFLACLR